MHNHTRPPSSRGDADVVTRRRLIVDIVSSSSVSSQSELAERLEERGMKVTQATLSRDLKALGIGKAPALESGYTYVLPSSRSEGRDDVSKGTLELEAFVREVRVINNLVVIRTSVGNAQGVARAIDDLRWGEVEGTISGDDTILVITGSNVRGKQFRERLSVLVGRKFT
jgi:transcriptional regulator of arginine metabolism